MFSKSKAVVCVALSAAMLLGLTEIEGTGASAATAATGSAIVTTGSAVTTLEPVANTGCGYKQDQVKQENHEPYGRKEDYPESDRNYIHRYLDQQ